MDKLPVDVLAPTAWNAKTEPRYGRFRSEPREDDGGWLDTVGPGEPGYEEAKKSFEENLRRTLNGISR